MFKIYLGLIKSLNDTESTIICANPGQNGAHLCCHKGEGVHAMGSSQQTTDHSQATAVQQQGDQQTKHSHMAVHGSGGRERQLEGRKCGL